MQSIARHSRDYLFAATVILISVALLSQPASADFIQQFKLVGNGATGASDQGHSVAVSADGNTTIVGGNGDSSGTGAAWVFVRSNGVWSQQGNKLVGLGAVGTASQGAAVALSADGNTAIIGGPGDNTGVGAAWVFTRTNGVWSQQGGKLVGSNNVGASQQGYSVALSADGNTAIIGGQTDNSSVGAAWVFTRSNGVWSQQGNKLVGLGAVGAAQQGAAVALSADGNTAIVGGFADNAIAGAAWVFTRTAGAWSQYGNKLVGNGASGAAAQGDSVALSGDASTAMLGGPADNANIGAAWVFAFVNGAWTQQGNKLVGSGGIGTIQEQGTSVALSGDGNTVLIGGPTDNTSVGAAWVFSRNGGVWFQQHGGKLVGTGASGAAQQGAAVALSADGITAIVEGPRNNNNIGAAWVFTRQAGIVTHDFNGDTRSDILWRDTGGNVAQWMMNGASIASGALLGNVPTSWSVVGQRDFNGDGMSDILWRDTGGNVGLWVMNGAAFASALVGNVPSPWAITGIGDFDGNGTGDIVWRNTSTGDVALWFMNGASVAFSTLVANVPTSWSIVGASRKNILWRDNAGNNALWIMNGSTVASAVSLGNVPLSWSIVGTGDFNGDGNLDVLWRDNTGNVAIWLLSSGGAISSSIFVGNVATSWTIAETGDFDGDGKSDIIWRDSGGNTAIWFMNGGAVASAASIGNVPTIWTIQGLNAD